MISLIKSLFTSTKKNKVIADRIEIKEMPAKSWWS
jgi:hypothetical protein